MSGVEAAASLFGSDEPGADLFATLGTDSTPTAAPAADDFFANDTSSSAADATDLFSQSSYSDYAAEPSVFPTQAAETLVNHMSETVHYDPTPTNGHAGQWGQQEQKSIVAEYTSTYTAAPATNYDPYTPSAYTPTTTKTNYSSYSAYDPPAPAAPVSPYTPYAPVSHTAAAPPTHSYAPAVSPPAPLAQPYSKSITSIPPVPPPKTTVSRPKVSNAYDPPFIPSRRPTRTATTATSSYSQYQTPSQPAYSAPSGYSQYQNPPPVALEPNHPPSTTSPVNNYSSHSHSNSAGSSHSLGQYDHGSSNYDAKPSSTYNGSYFPQVLVEQTSTTPHKNEGQNDQTYTTSNVIGDDVYAPVENGHAESASPLAEEPTSLVRDNHEERRPSMDSVASDAVSPRTVPLPFSPPVQKEDLEDFEGGGMTHSEAPSHLPPPPHIPAPPQQSPYIPQHTVKKDFGTTKEVYDPYAPRLTQSANNYIPRTSSPLSLGARSNDLRKASIAAPSHLNGAIPSPYSSVPKPIAPPPPVAPLKVPTNDDYTSRLVPHNLLAPQDIIMKGISTQYAPSPSLVGANDPLSRTSARAPVITFGFGGKMITCFHGMPGLNAGFDVALSSRTSSELKIHTLKKIIPATVLNMPGPSFPGPLLADPGTSSISLIKSGQTTQTKTKKTSLVTYLTDRFNEIQQGLGYLSNAEKQHAEDRLVLLKLLSIMVENDGHLSGTPQIDAAVRTALVPRLEGLSGLQDGLSLQASFSSPSLDEAPISVTTLKPSTLDKIEEFLLQGDRRQAYQFAMDQNLWAHAMIIASSIDKESWKEVINDFLRTELGSKEDAARGGPAANGIRHSQNNRESLRVAYSLFSGQGAAAVQELAPVTLLQSANRLQPPPPMLQTPPMLQPPASLAAPAITPRTPNFPPMASTVPIPAETLAKWPETAAMIISSPLTLEVTGALTALGDQLQANNWVEAAHVCYLLSSQTTLLGGFGHPSARITLLGTKNPTDALKNPDTIVYSEIMEFAMSLVPTTKGQEPFHGIPHLQAYRFMRAILLAEIGEIQLANRYCEAIASSLTQGSPYTNTALLEQLQGLQQRLSGVFHGDKSGSWIGGKISKPSLDTIGGWLEGRFTKLVTGESDSPTPTDHKATGQPFAGPFAHYSTISTTPSGRSSPQPAAIGLTTAPPHRTASAMATSSPYSQVNIERSSSAMDHVRQPPSQVSKNYAGSLSSSQSSPTGYGLNGHSRYDDAYSTSYQSKSHDEEPPAPQSSSWWSSTGNDMSPTPTATNFMQVEDSSIQPSSDGFISLMDDQNFVGPSQHHQQATSSSSYTIDDEDDDLGLGNSKPKPKPIEDETSNGSTEDAASQPTKSTPAAAPEKKIEPAQQSGGGSWFGRWWKRGDAVTPGPIKASLGEESAFYYDKEQKRWVNKKAGAEEAVKPAAPPPPPSRTPSRAQTASPGMTGGPKPAAQVSAQPPRSASAAGLGEPPNKAPMRIRSNLAPPTESAPSTPTGTRMNLTGPPPARPKSGAAKRNIRSRYVDVFQQESGGSAA